MSILAEQAIRIYLCHWVYSENIAYKEQFHSKLSQLLAGKNQIVRFQTTKDHIFQKEIYRPLCARMELSAQQMVESHQCIGVCQVCKVHVERALSFEKSPYKFDNKLMVYCSRCQLITDIYF